MTPPGPAPRDEQEKTRRNKPTIPTTLLSAAGRTDDPPELPEGKSLAGAGDAWWRWAWGTPQALAWDDGSLHFVFRRAELEDDLAVLELVDDVDISQLLSLDEDEDLYEARKEAVEQIEFAFRALKRLAGGRIGVMKEMRELDNRLGLNPKAMIDLRWKIIPADSTPEQNEQREEQQRTRAPRRGGDRRDRLSVVK